MIDDDQNRDHRMKAGFNAKVSFLFNKWASLRAVWSIKVRRNKPLTQNAPFHRVFAVPRRISG
jgi:hypothetical protein